MAEEKEEKEEKKTKKPAKKAKGEDKLREKHFKEFEKEQAAKAKKAREEVLNRPPCEHINLHSCDVNGLPDELACTKDEGHAGNHGALHTERGDELLSEIAPEKANELRQVVVGTKTMIVDGSPKEVGGKMVYEGEIFREWSDAAGAPTEEILPARDSVTMLGSPYGEFGEKS